MINGLAVRAERVFDGERLLPQGALVLVDGERIVAVEPVTAPVPDGHRLLEFPGGTLLPGLVDAHVHLCCDSGDGALDRLADHDEATAATAIGFGTRKGRIRPGHDADLLLVHGDPFTDPHALKRPATVLLRGQSVL